jgi:hypothetical protein
MKILPPLDDLDNFAVKRSGARRVSSSAIDFENAFRPAHGIPSEKGTAT